MRSKANPLPSPDETTSHSTDEAPSQATRLSKDDNQVAGYKPASGQVAGYLPRGEGTNVMPKASPLPNPLPLAGEGANAEPKAVYE